MKGTDQCIVKDKYKTVKGFQVIPLETTTDINKLFCSFAICDSCNTPMVEGGTYIAVLNRCYCKDCFNEWHAEAVNYPEDRAIEKRQFTCYFERAKRLEII